MKGTGEGSQAPDIRRWPGHPAPGDVNDSSSPAAQVLQAPDIRRQPRTSGASGHPGHPARSPEIRRPLSREHRGRPRQPGHPAPQPGHPAPREGPDIRPPCLRAVHLGRGPCTPSPLRLYILPLHLRFRVSKGLAHLGIELCSSIRIYSTERDRGLYGEDPPWIQDPSREDPSRIQDLLT
jgi:hypothetical protein